ncbi:hypothetical protein KP806_18305 [Paenibacillus sp. N4]|uniref:hypothetical protein n=1 Tax=Paenibacillus vietnamensis TaxID=2590547 RepID=UPI001CD1516E|nr:hypothetical protein [Paenibacillus vietnamensis]MCA0757017.1 hypothetical protein [Paenibacillus vietnamensis]
MENQNHNSGSLTIIVVDTNILVKGFIEKDLMTLLTFLNTFYNRKSQVLPVDYSDVVMKEYRDNMKDDPLFQKWFVHMQTNNQIQYVDGNLDQKVRKRLLELGFHEETDQTFVAVTLNSGGVIVTEDSDYGKGKEEKAAEKQKVLNYLTEELGLQVYDVNEICSMI